MSDNEQSEWVEVGGERHEIKLNYDRLNRQLADQWIAMGHERDRLRAQRDRLREELRTDLAYELHCMTDQEFEDYSMHLQPGDMAGE